MGGTLFKRSLETGAFKAYKTAARNAQKMGKCYFMMSPDWKFCRRDILLTISGCFLNMYAPIVGRGLAPDAKTNAFLK